MPQGITQHWGSQSHHFVSPAQTQAQAHLRWHGHPGESSWEEKGKGAGGKLLTGIAFPSARAVCGHKGCSRCTQLLGQYPQCPCNSHHCHLGPWHL